ncbi:CBS domain-containing protein [Streptomyces luteolifulvus]|jgi:CBS domain-containing protein|uniref:CBS domain-containing protein n=1 Tax=Streptomyces luteolifulvus TaxID=2615112 RepID=A0A6H9UQ74_9ACTN|nr:CBS domain-containing protein [Streptomyces luteolifulvus]KAB1140091.1 CBS domain-containing protein [Streptomyces luteolifulvus]
MPDSPHTVSDVMTHTVVAVGRDAPFKEIVELFDQWKVSALPVLEGEGRVIGVVSEADLLHKEEFRDADEQSGELADRIKAGAVTAGELMSAPAVTVHADATLAEAARIMARRHVKRLPVVDGVGLLQGVVSRGDLLKVFLRSDEEIAEEIRNSVLGRLPVTGPLTVAVAEGVVTLAGSLPERGLEPVLARAVRAVEGVVDVRLDLTHR